MNEERRLTADWVPEFFHVSYKEFLKERNNMASVLLMGLSQEQKMEVLVHIAKDWIERLPEGNTLIEAEGLTITIKKREVHDGTASPRKAGGKKSGRNAAV